LNGDLFSSGLATDLLLSIPLISVVLLAVLLTKRSDDLWVNRKLIHLSSAPAVLAYIHLFNEPYVFSTLSALCGLFLLVLRRMSEMRWFQSREDVGEVIYCFSFSAISIVLWETNRCLGGVIMLFMAVGDAVTGIVRSAFTEERGKHVSGTVAMFAVSSLIGFVYLGPKGVLLALVASLAELQPWVDDNLMIPVCTLLTAFLI